MAVSADPSVAQVGEAVDLTYTVTNPGTVPLVDVAGLKPGVAMLSTPDIQAYIELASGFEPKDAPYLENHRGHLMFVKAEEKKFVTADLIANTSFTASEAEIKKRIGALRDAGYTQFTIQLVPGEEHALAGAKVFTAPACNVPALTKVGP